METQSKRVISLLDFDNVGLIVKVPSGVLYTNQVEGYACQHPEVEGVFFPLPVRPGNAELFALTQHFQGTWDHITESDADLVDRVLRGNGHEGLSVDRTKVNQSYEAWVHVRIGADVHGLSGFGNCEAVLTWPNSD